MEKRKTSNHPPAGNTQPMQLTSDAEASRSVSPTLSILVQSTRLGQILPNPVQHGTSNTPSVQRRNLSTHPNCPDSVESSQMTSRTRNVIMSYREMDMINRGFTAFASLPQIDVCDVTSSYPISYSKAKSYFKIANSDSSRNSENYEEKFPRPPSPIAYPCSGNFKYSCKHLHGENPVRISNRACNEHVPTDATAGFCPVYMKELTDMQFRAAKTTNRRQTFRTDSNSFSTNEASVSTSLSNVTNEVNNQDLTTLMSEASED